MVAKRIQSMTQSDVRSVYSGKDGKCCCGCAGKHYYNSLHVKEASKDRGYEVLPEDVNDKMITKVLSLMKADPLAVEDNGDFFSLVVGTRLYVAYLTKAGQKKGV